MRGILWVRRGFQEVAGVLGVKGVVEGDRGGTGGTVVRIFLVGGRRGDRGGTGGAETNVGVMTKGVWRKSAQDRAGEFLWVQGSSVFGSVDGLFQEEGQRVPWVRWGFNG